MSSADVEHSPSHAAGARPAVAYPAGAEPPSSPPAPAPADPSPVPRPRSALDTVDATMTAVGERLRDPEVQATARRAARHASDAVAAGVAGIGRRTPHDGTGAG